jgi:hypothetical protein
MHYYNFQPLEDNSVNFESQKAPVSLGWRDNNQYKPLNINKIQNNILDNIVQFNKNLTEDEVNNTNVNNIIKYDNLMSLREFDKMLLAKEYEKLYHKTRDANIKQDAQYFASQFQNMSLTDIYMNFIKTFKEMINEYSANPDKINIEFFTKKDRSIYIGILFIIISLFLYFISSSS